MKLKLSVVILLLVITGCITRQAQPTGRGVSGFESPLYTHHYWMPLLIAQKAPTPTPQPACFKSTAAEQFYLMMLYDARQQRRTIVCDPRLVAAAELRANDLVKRDYFAHCDPDGVCANAVARSAGCKLPDDYAANGNSIEELGGGTPDASSMFVALARSPSHKIHLFGETEAFRAQQQTGIAMVKGGRFGFVWVVLIGTCK